MKRIRLEFSSLLSDDDSTLLRSTIIADPGYFVCSFRSTKILTISQFLIFLDRLLIILARIFYVLRFRAVIFFPNKFSVAR